MKDYNSNRHPGPWRVMQIDSEFAGILVAVGFVAMGLVSIPVARWFVIGCLALGIAFAVLFHFIPMSTLRPVVGTVAVTVIVLTVAVTWWTGRPPRRPLGVSSNAVYVLPNNVPREWGQTGYWLECWFDQQENADRCKLTDKSGSRVFEDAYVTCGSQATIPQNELVIKPPTGRKWVQSRDKLINVPVLYARYEQILFPRSLYAEAKQQSYCYGS